MAEVAKRLSRQPFPRTLRVRGNGPMSRAGSPDAERRENQPMEPTPSGRLIGPLDWKEMKIKLPTLRGQSSYYPKTALCPWCQKNKVLEPYSSASLCGGALLMIREDDSGGPDEKMDGFLSLSWHGAHDGAEGKDREIYATVEIAHDVRGGQFDLYFCSTKCLRSYLNFCIDELEKKIKAGKTRSNKSLKRDAAKNRRAP